MLNEKDPNDPVKISFTVKDESLESWFDERIHLLRVYDPLFYCHQIPTKNGTMYQITTKYRNLQSEDYKKFMFQIKLKLGEDAKVR